MTDNLIRPERNGSHRDTFVADRPIDFETWVSLPADLDTELIKGVLVSRTATDYAHQWIFMWLASILSQFAGKRGLGVVLGSRTAVKIDRYDGRLPDILFVRTDNKAIIHKDAIYGAPDVVIEIVSPNDHRSDLIALETDYSSIGVPEIVFIDPQRKHVRLLQRTEAGEYDETFLMTGRLDFRAVPGFHIEVEWIFSGDPPAAFDITAQLLQQAAGG